MTYFFDLVFNENVKIYKRPRGMILLGLLIFMNLFIAIVMKYIFSDTNFTLWDHLNISTYIVFVLNFICIIIAGDIVSSEFSSGTIKLLLIRPANRIKILLAKYVAVIMFVALVVSLHLVTSIIFGSLFFYSGSLIFEWSFILTILLNYIFGFIEIVIVCTFAIMLSVVTRSSVFSVSVPIFMIMSFKLILEVMSHYNVQQGKYLLFANSNLAQHFSGRAMFEGMTLSFSILNITIHMVSFLVISVVVFSRRDINV